MKKILPVAPVLLFFLLTLFPMGKVIGCLAGYDFILYSDLAFAVFLAFCSCTLMVGSLWCQAVLSPNVFLRRYVFLLAL